VSVRAEFFEEIVIEKLLPDIAFKFPEEISYKYNSTMQPHAK
jgi:hypothetical protein